MKTTATIIFEQIVREMTAAQIAEALQAERAQLAERFDALEAKLNERPTSIPKAVPQATFARLHGISTTTVWRQIKAGRLPFVTVGKRKLVLVPDAHVAP